MSERIGKLFRRAFDVPEFQQSGSSLNTKREARRVYRTLSHRDKARYRKSMAQAVRARRACDWLTRETEALGGYDLPEKVYTAAE